MNYLYYIYIFILGAALGSFYNVVGLRISEGKSIARPRSSCPKCGHELSWWELIPIINYFFLVGKCHKCKSQISIKYMLFELVTALLFVYSYFILGFNLELIVILSFISLLVIITVSDLEYMLIEDKVIIFFLIVIFIERIFIQLPEKFTTFYLPNMVEFVLGGIFGFGLLFLIAFFGEKFYKKEVMGGGDIKLYGIIGLILGVKLTLFSLFMSSLLGSVIGLSLTKLNIIKKDTPIPFGPFIALGSLIAYFYGLEIIKWYFSII